MTHTIRFKQIKPLTVTILGYLLGIIWLLLLLYYNAPISQLVVLFLLFIVLIGYSFTYDISKTYANKKTFNLFGFAIFKQKLPIIYPEYIVVMSSSFSSSSEWGSIAALGKGKEYSFYIIRLFKGRSNFTLYKSLSSSITNQKAEELAKLLNVPIQIKNI